MIGRVVEIAQEGTYCRLYRGFLIVEKGHQELGRVPLEDCESLILAANDVTVSRQLLARMAENHTTVLVCDSSYEPVGIYLPAVGNQRQAERQQAQVRASAPLKKNLWAALVRGKIHFQEVFLKEAGREAEARQLYFLGRNVQSGDKTNREAQAARIYWQALFGKDFRRDTEEGTINALLNYGYAVLRSSVARALSGAGLFLGWGLGHVRKDNPMALCDDVMEPFRPSVDRIVHRLAREGKTELDPETKKTMARVLWTDLEIDGETVPVMNAVGKLVHTLVDSFLEKRCLIDVGRWRWSLDETFSTGTD